MKKTLFLFVICCLLGLKCFSQEQTAHKIKLMVCDTVYRETTVDNLQLPDAETLPFKCKNEKWTLAGWTTDVAFSDTRTNPELLTGSFVPTQDTTLYAVYQSEADSLVVMEKGALLHDWTSKSCIKATDFLSLPKLGEGYILSDSCDLSILDSVNITYKTGNSCWIQFFVCDKNVQTITSNKVAELLDKSTSYINRQVKLDITAQQAATKYYLQIKNISSAAVYFQRITLKYKPQYTIAPVCTDEPEKTVNIMLMNCGKLHSSLTYTTGEEIELPTDARCSDASEVQGWTFKGWSSEQVDNNTNTPDLINPATFSPNTDTTLYAVYSQSNYTLFDADKENDMAIGALTPDGCVLLPSDKIQPKDNQLVQGASPMPYNSLPVPLIDANSVNGMTWNVRKNITGNFIFEKAYSTVKYLLQPACNTNKDSEQLNFSQKNLSEWLISQADNNLYLIKSKINPDRALTYDKANNRFGCFIAEIDDINYFQATLIAPVEYVFSTNPTVVLSVADTETAVIESEDEYLVDELNITVSPNGVGQIEHTAPIVSECGVTVTINLLDSKEFMFALPFDCNTCDIEIIAGEDTLLYGVDWYLSQFKPTETYSALGLKADWVRTDEIEQLNAGIGYQITLLAENASNPTVRFVYDQPITFDPTTPITISPSETVSTDTVLSQIGWQYIASPYFGNYNRGSIYFGDGQTLKELTVANRGGVFQTTLFDAQRQNLISPFTPFLVQTTADADITFMPSEDAVMPDPTYRLKLYVSSSSGADSTVVEYNGDNTVAYEIGYDLLKLTNPSSSVSVYSISDSIDFYVNSLNVKRPLTLQLGIVSAQEQTVTFSIPSDFDTTFGNVYLKDNGKLHNLQEGEYSTTVANGRHDKRFALYFSSTTSTTVDNLADTANVSYSLQDNLLTISKIDAGLTVCVTDAVGHQIAHYESNAANATLSVQLPARGVYMITCSAGTSVQTHKIVY